MDYLARLKAEKRPPQVLTKLTKAPSVGSVSTPTPRISRSQAKDYTPADLVEMDRLLRELAQLEGWSPALLDEALACRQRMAPARVLEVLAQLRKWTAAALAPWPESPPERPKIVLTVFDGDKGAV